MMFCQYSLGGDLVDDVWSVCPSEGEEERTQTASLQHLGFQTETLIHAANQYQELSGVLCLRAALAQQNIWGPQNDCACQEIPGWFCEKCFSFSFPSHLSPPRSLPLSLSHADLLGYFILCLPKCLMCSD